MDFEKIMPEWKNKGNEPSNDLKEVGFVGTDRLPATILNWFIALTTGGITELQKKVNKETFHNGGVYTGDMNELVTPAQYRVQSNVNLPTEAYYGQVFVGRAVTEGGNNDTVTQLVISYSNGKMFYRGAILRNGVWTWEDWSSVYSTNNKPKLNTVAWLGSNPVTTTADDTTAKWSSLGSGFAQYNVVNQLTDQPSQYGFLINYAYASDVFQIWTILPSGARYTRSGNANGWYQSWTKIYDEKNKPTSTELGVAALSGGTAIPEGVDLDEYITAGNYHCSGDAIATTLLNCPVTNAFRMRVGYPTGSPTYIYQEIFNWVTGTRYYRQKIASSTIWTNWQTAYDSAGIIPISNGGTNAKNVNGAVTNLLIKMLINNTSVVNANTLVKTGIHKVYLTDETLASDNNYPYVYGNLVVISNMEETNYAYVMQVFLTTDGKTYIRSSTDTGSTWTTWKKQSTLENLVDGSKNGSLRSIGSPEQFGIGLHALQIGNYSRASGDYSVALGGGTATGSKSFAVQNGTSNGDKDTSFGYRTVSKGTCQFVIGKHNVEHNGATSLGDTTGSVFIVGCGYGNGTDPDTKANALRVTNDGKCYGQNAFAASGADYAEYFEWIDGNPDNEDRRGYFVALEGAKIRKATAEDNYILGVISATPVIEGNTYSDMWQGMYLTDVFGERLTETVEVPETTDKETDTVIPAHTETRFILNPEYDPEKEYKGRNERPEWAAVGMFGQLVVVDDGTCEVNGYCKVADGGIATKTDEMTAYRVMERLDDTHIRILIK